MEVKSLQNFGEWLQIRLGLAKEGGGMRR